VGSPEQLRVRLLGGLDIEGLDERAIGSRKARTLVKVLALARGSAVSADTVVEALWPDGDAPTKPMDQIGVLVSRLRSVIGGDRLARSDAGWSLTVDWLDVAELENRVDEAAARLAAGSPTAARAAARAALDLIRGELLADEPDPVWAEAERVAVARLIARARIVAAEATLAVGDPADAAAVAEGALDHDPYDEAALRTLMRAHAAAGRPASALAAYARMRERLSEDLGVDPVKETEELHTAILLSEPLVMPEAVVPRATARLVGRVSELAVLDAALAQAQSGAAASVVIEGEAGIGKTALVNAWLSARGGDTATFVGRCDELGRGLPLQPLLDALAAHVRHHPDLEVPASLVTLLGPIATASDAQPTTVTDPVLGQAQLFADLLGTFEHASGDRTCVVVVEDVHLAAASTVEWLYYAARRGRRLLVVSTRRSGDPAADVLHLGPLDLDAVTELVGDDRANDLYARSGGHPLFLVELAAAGDELPTSVRDAVASRIDQLGEAANTLRTAAILGSEIDVDLLAGVLGTPVASLLEHIDAGLSNRIVEEKAALTFCHELVREALEASTTAARRAFIHREAARVLRDRVRHDPLEVAWHASQGGDVETASAALIQAAAVATERHDVTLAHELLGEAIALVDTVDARLARARVRIARWDADGAREDTTRAVELGAGAAALEVAGWAEYYRRDYELAFRLAEEAIASTTDPGLRASCLAMSGRVLHARGDLHVAEERLTEAIATAPPSVRGIAHVWMACLSAHRGDPEQAGELVDRALAQQQWLNHPFAVHHGHMWRTLAFGQRGRIVDAMRASAEARAAAEVAGASAERFVSAVDNVHSWLLRGVGRLQEADEFSTRVLERTTTDASVSTNEQRHASMLDLVDGRLLIDDLDGSAAAIARAAPVETLVGTMAWHHRQRYWVQCARFALATHDLDTAGERAEQTIADADERGADRYGLFARVIAARVAVARGEPIDHEAMDAVLVGLERCGGLEAWLVTAQLAAATGVDRWWRDADRRAGALVAVSGEHAEGLRQWIGSRFVALGR
jgi:DNA-binding SARP family transcriptional activator